MVAKGKIWYGLRISFWAFVIIYVLGFNDYFYDFISILSFGNPSLGISILSTIAIISTLVFSIFHLRKYSQKTFAIIALIISVLNILSILKLIFISINF